MRHSIWPKAVSQSYTLYHVSYSYSCIQLPPSFTCLPLSIPCHGQDTTTRSNKPSAIWYLCISCPPPNQLRRSDSPVAHGRGIPARIDLHYVSRESKTSKAAESLCKSLTLVYSWGFKSSAYIVVVSRIVE